MASDTEKLKQESMGSTLGQERAGLEGEKGWPSVSSCKKVSGLPGGASGEGDLLMKET